MVRFQPVTWLIWTFAAAVTALLTRNPLYILIIGLAAWLVYLSVGHASSQARSWRGLLRLGALVWLIAVPLNALMVHEGTHVLFRLPLSWPLVGGAITLEAVAYGLATGFAVWVLLLIFASFNLAVDASQLLRLVPAFLYQVGVIASIALTFVPQMLTSAREIREAQCVRGHRFRNWRDLLPLIMPLLTTSMEHAISLAESMESRGFGGQVTGLSLRQRNGLAGLNLLSLALLLAGLFLNTFWRGHSLVGTALIVCACIMLLAGFATLSRHVTRSRYRRAEWHWPDTLLCVASVAVVAILVVVRLAGSVSLSYYPYPPYPLIPSFHPLVGSALILLALPGLLPLLAGQSGIDAASGVIPSGEPQ